MSEVQDITRKPDRSVTEMFWAEGGAASEPSAGLKDTGLVAGVAPPADDFNWPELEQMRWLRALFSRFADASDEFFSTWLVSDSTWSGTGVPALDGFLSDSGGVDSLVADLWVEPDVGGTGAVRVQVQVTKASPFTFLPTRDTYFFVPIDMIVPPTVTLADMTAIDVAVAAGEPATPAGTKAIWRVRTDGASITQQELLVPSAPTLKSLILNGSLEVMLNALFSGTTTFTGVTNLFGPTTTITSAVTSLLGAANTIAGSTTVISSSVSTTVSSPTTTVSGTATNLSATTTTVTGTATNLNATTTTVAGAAVLNGMTSVNEDLTVATAKDVVLSGTASVLGTITSVLQSGKLRLVDGAIASANELVSAFSSLLWHDGASAKIVHVSPNGTVYATGDQEAVTAALTNQLIAQTTVAVVAQGNGLVRVIAEGWCQVTIVGNNIDFHVQEDITASPAWTTIGTIQTDQINKILSNDDWQFFRIERTFAAGILSAGSYRLRVDPIGTTARVRNTNLRVVPERG